MSLLRARLVYFELNINRGGVKENTKQTGDDAVINRLWMFMRIRIFKKIIDDRAIDDQSEKFPSKTLK